MSDAVRNVTIVMNIQPGDTSAIKSAIRELQEMRGITDEVVASTKKVTEATDALAQADKDAVKQHKELLNAKQDEYRIEKDLVDNKRRLGEQLNTEQRKAIDDRLAYEERKNREHREREERAQQDSLRRQVEQAERAVAQFTTSKGSTYEAFGDGTTIRNKALRNDPGHEGDSGIKERSAKTIYLDADASALSAAGLDNYGGKARVVLQDGKASMVTWNEEQNKWGASPSSRDIAYHHEPAVGRYPLELWNPRSDVHGMEAYGGMHAGNKIVSMRIEQKKRDADEEVKIERETVRQIEEIRRPLREPRSVRPLREPDGKVPFYPGGGPPNEPPKPPKTDLSEFSKQIDDQIDANFAAFEENEKKKTEAAKREAEQRARDAEQAMAEMPKHWRNVGLNAGQAVASAARFVGHMRMLKNVGGEALEDVARQFMTIQSRVETIAAATSFFTNTGTMLDGLRVAGEATEKIVKQQIALGQATTFTQTATMNLGKTAAGLSAMVAPAQFAFTALTASVVALDIAMDMVGESTEANKKRMEEYLQSYERELDKVIKKLEIQKQLTQAETNILEEQWRIKKALAGDEGLTAEQIVQKNAQMRRQKDREAEDEIVKGVPEIFQAGITDKQKQESARIDAERKRINDELKNYQDKGFFRGQTFETAEEVAAYKRFLENSLKQLAQDKANLDTSIGAAWFADAGKVGFENGTIKEFDKFMTALEKMPKDMQDASSKMLILAQQQLVEGSQLNRTQYEEASRAAKEAEMTIKRREADVQEFQGRQADERAVATRFQTDEGKSALGTAMQALADADKAKGLDERSTYVQQAREALQNANLMSPELDRELARGAAANTKDARTLIQDSSEFTAAEQRDTDKLIEEAQMAIMKAEDDRDAMKVIMTKMTTLLETHDKQYQEVIRALENRDLN